MLPCFLGGLRSRLVARAASAPIHPPTRSTRALSPAAFAPGGPSSAAARTSAWSALSSTARTPPLSPAGRCVGPCASSTSPRYARPTSSHAAPSVESRPSRARSDASESGMLAAPGGGACRSAATASALERNVAMLLGRIAVPLGRQGGERPDEPGPGVPRVDDVVHVAAPRCEIRVGEFLPVLRLPLLARLLSFIEDFDRTLGPHDRDLRRGPCHVVVPADVLRVHHVVGAAVRLAGDHGELRDRGLAVGVQQLRPVLDDPPVLLGHTRERSEEHTSELQSHSDLVCRLLLEKKKKRKKKNLQ